MNTARIDQLQAAGVYDALVNALRIDHEMDTGSARANAYNMGVKHGVDLMVDRILEDFDFTRAELKAFKQWARSIK